MVDQFAALFHPRDAGVNKALDLLGRLGAAAGQRAHLASHHGKTATLLARTGSFYSSIEGQNISLKGNAVNHADDVGNFARAVVDAFHGVYHLGHHLAAF